ncbi:MAG: hypothetical protein COV29_02690 [Candidatus Yanofskybacteria bacterium CG10_big_fil_rev_8_21_14_0_10_36_16]|uniref:DUF4015 domain-containing protein n=1 Tax=Candidatus Yanofskybacteria bacterium CG10_big_fil_rev_8_21_14_0_10_36_16 TaxID=1975096 RepID=A0A2J0Q7U5_9BACT|nr:MAG: hypothetical protein COV29_02690 [Candidatus Yanofskybacteria bacterium CG10_big_fil_rev_8_21_14_0_10_36_16]
MGEEHDPNPPSIVKAVYLTVTSVSNSDKLSGILKNLEGTEINALIIDIRSNGQNVLFMENEKVKNILNHLHSKGFYLIARIVVFNAGKSWYDPGNKNRWRVVADSSLLALSLGFDEINYDYVRYGSVNEPKSNTPVSERRGVIKSFFEFLREEVGNKTGKPISVDIFGITFLKPSNTIGQALEDAAENFDYVMPMPYPSHWSQGSFGFENPAHHPYDVVYKSLISGWNKTKDNPATRAKLRTWVQAFNLDSHYRYYKYSEEHIRAQINACYDAGCVGWALWNPNNRYDRESLIPKERRSP